MGWDCKVKYIMGCVKRICVFEHSVMTHFNCAVIQRGQGSGFLSEGSSWLAACMSESGGSGETVGMRRLAWTFAARISDKYQIPLMRPLSSSSVWFGVHEMSDIRTLFYHVFSSQGVYPTVNEPVHEIMVLTIGNQRRLRGACASAQSRQSLRYWHTWNMEVDEGSDQKSDL